MSPPESTVSERSIRLAECIEWGRMRDIDEKFCDRLAGGVEGGVVRDKLEFLGDLRSAMPSTVAVAPPLLVLKIVDVLIVVKTFFPVSLLIILWCTSHPATTDEYQRKKICTSQLFSFDFSFAQFHFFTTFFKAFTCTLLLYA